jgi:hypothetical protein
VCIGWPADLTWYKLLTDWGSFIGGVLALIAGGLLYYISRRQFKLARAEFISTHGPKITVRAFRLHLEGVTADYKYPIEFIYLNEGETAAHIRQIRSKLISGDNLWTYGARKIYFDDVTTPTVKLMRGEQRMHLTKADFHWDAKDNNWFCVGDIEYRDDHGLQRKTGFCRRWNPSTKNWDREKNEEYDYAY